MYEHESKDFAKVDIQRFKITQTKWQQYYF